MVSSVRSVVIITFILLVNDFKVLAENQGQMRTLYLGPPPKPVPGEHWMQAAVRELRKQRCPGVPACLKEEPLGMEDGRIVDDSITASSYWENRADHRPAKARLNNQGYAAAWVVGSGDANPWIQVDFTTTVTITGLITQGRGEDVHNNGQRVTKYQVEQSEDGQSWDHVTYTNGTVITFPGNTDRNSYVTNTFPAALRTRFVRILPTGWNIYCSMRFEVIGCYGTK